MKRSVDKRLPVGDPGGLVVPIQITVPDRGDRAPKIEDVFGVEHGDVGVSSGHFCESEEARILQQRSRRRAS